MARTADGVYVTAADTASLDLDIDVVVTEWLQLEEALVELGDGRSINLETFSLIGVGHGEYF